MQPSARLEINYMGLVNWGDDPTAIPGGITTFTTPSQVIVNARISLGEIPIGPAVGKLSIWGKNITDQRYISEVLPGAVIGFVDANVSPPATYGVDLSFKY